MSRSDVEEGCVLLPILFIVLIVKCALVLVAYGFAIMMCCFCGFYMPFIIIVAIIKNDSDLILNSLFCWFVLAQEFSKRLFK
jgi:hypothetical protein